MKTIGNLISRVVAGASGIAGILVLLLVLHVSADVAMRYVFERPLDATILYVSAYYMVAIAFLPLGLAEEKNSHIAVELLAENFPDKVQSVLAAAALLVTAIVTGAVALRTGQEALAKFATGSYSIEAGGKIITWPPYFFLPIGFGLMALVAFWKLIARLTGQDSGLSVLTVEDPYLPKDTPDV